MDDNVAKDAKRLLLRYGAPISVVDRLSDDERKHLETVLPVEIFARRSAML